MALIGYARCSTEEQARDSNALQYQASRLEEHAGIGNVVKDFTSASKVPLRKREAFMEAVDRLLVLPEGIKRVLLVTRWDRLSRRVEDIQFMQGLVAKGIQFKSLDAGELAGGAMGQFNFTVQLAMAEYEANLISEKITIRYQDRRKARQPMNTPPWGYRIEKCLSDSGVSRRYVVDPEQGPLVGEIYQSVLDSDGNLNAVVRRYSHLGLPKTAEGMRLWLLNPAMLGHIHYKERRDRTGRLISEAFTAYNTHQPLVEQGLYDAVQARLAERRVHRPRLVDGSRPVHPLCGLVRCPGCGYAVSFSSAIYRCKGTLGGQRKREPGAVTVRWAANCRQRHIGRCPCEVKTVMGRPVIEALLKETVERLCTLSQSLRVGDQQSLEGAAEVPREERLLEQQINSMRQQDAALYAAAISALEGQLEQLRLARSDVDAQRAGRTDQLRELDLKPEAFFLLSGSEQNTLLRQFVLSLTPAYQDRPAQFKFRV